MGAFVHRTRKSRTEWVPETEQVHIRPGCVPSGDHHVGAQIEFELAAAGGGTSRIAVTMTAESFEDLVYAMYRVNRKAAMDAFAWVQTQEFDDDD